MVFAHLPLITGNVLVKAGFILMSSLSMALKASLESRRYIRIKPLANHPVRVDINGENFIEILHVVDISEAGIGICVPYGFEGCRINEDVSFVLELPLQRHAILHVSGKITHVSGHHFGVSFVCISEEARRAIRQYIAGYLREKSLLDWIKYKLGMI